MNEEHISAKAGYGSADLNPFGESPEESLISRTFPLAIQLRSYARENLRFDVVAGITLAALAIPQAMAYAQTAGMPVVAGLYALLIPLVAYATLSSSRRLMTGPTATAALMVPSAILGVSHDPTAYPALAAVLALTVALVFAFAYILRLGWIANYFSVTVLLGFLTGLALTLIADQLHVFTGATFDGETPFQKYYNFLTAGVYDIDPLTTTIGALSLVALVVGKKFFPHVPMLLFVAIGAIASSYAFEFSTRGVLLVGTIPSGIPEFVIPNFNVNMLREFLPAALGIAVVAFADAILVARSVVRADEPAVDANQELLALAGLNAAAGISQSFPLGSSGSRTAVNVRLGGRTQLVSLVLATSAALVLLFLTAPLSQLPKATLGAIIIFAAIGLIDTKEWKHISRISPRELALAAVVVVGMLTIGMLPSISLAVLLSIIDAVQRSAKPTDAVLGLSASDDRFVDVRREPESAIIPGIVVYRWDGRLFFANSTYFSDRVRAAIDGAPYDVRYLILSCEAITNIDATGAQTLRGLTTQLSSQGIEIVAARNRTRFTALMHELQLDDSIPQERRFNTVREAVNAIVEGQI